MKPVKRTIGKTFPGEEADGSGDNSSGSGSSGGEEEVYMTLDEEPRSRGFRFRYGCEGPSHGGITGEKSERGRRTFPTVSLHGYDGKAARIIASLICHDDPWRPHAHSLVGKNVVSGQAVVEIGAESNWQHSFSNLGILHVTKKNVSKVLMERYALALVQDLPCELSAQEPCPGEELPGGKDALKSVPRDVSEKLEALAVEQAGEMNLSAARLCFQAFLPDEEGQFTQGVKPVVSQVIYDSKSPASSALKICRMHRNTGSVSGGEEIYILCDRVQREDIQVKFISESSEDPWEADGFFAPSDVHRQCAIIVKTPPYWDPNIDHPVNVTIRLKRKTGEEMSEGKRFTYTPYVEDVEQIGRKRKKLIPRFDPDETRTAVLPRSSTASMFATLPAAASSTSRAAPTLGGSTPFQPSNGAVHMAMPRVVATATTQTSAGASSSWLTNPNGWGFAAVANRSQVAVDSSNVHGQIAPMMNSSGLSSLLSSAGQGLNGGLVSNNLPGNTLTTANLQNNSSASGRRFEESALALDQVTAAIQQATTPMDTTGSLHSPGQMGSGTLLQSTQIPSPASSSNRSLFGGQPAGPTAAAAQSPLAGGGVLLTPQSNASLPALSPQTPNLNSLNAAAAVASITPAKLTHNLQCFASTGNVALLEEGGQNLLHLAVKAMSMDATSILTKLLPHLPKALINSPDRGSDTMLHLAVSTKQTLLAAELVRCGADIALSDSQGNSSVHLACKAGNAPMLRALRLGSIGSSNGASDNNGHSSSSSKDQQQTLLQRIDQPNYDGMYPVHLAIKAKNLECLQALKAASFAMDTRGGLCGSTPLHNAVEENLLTICVYLLNQQCADINARNFQGNTALHLSSKNGLLEMTRTLLQSGANPIIKNIKSQLPLDLASSEALKAALRNHTTQ